MCCSVDLSLPVMMNLFDTYSCERVNSSPACDLEQIVVESEEYLDGFIPDSSSVPFLDVTSSESVLIEAKRLGVLSDPSYESIVSLQKEESKKFRSAAEALSDFVSKDDIRSTGAAISKLIHPGQGGYFMNRFVLDWKILDRVSYNVPVKRLDAEGDCFCSCTNGDEMVAKVRHMIDADWLYLSVLSRKAILRDSREENDPSIKTEQVIGKTMDHAILSASRALVSLKSIPVAARRALPVLVNAEGVLLSIPVHNLLFLLLCTHFGYA